MRFDTKLTSSITLLVVAVFLVHTGTSLTCPRDFCKNVTCHTNVTADECCEGYHLANTYCGCCHYCEKDLPEYASCQNLGGLTIPWNTVCAKGLVCCNGTTCLTEEDCKNPSCGYHGTVAHEVTNVAAVCTDWTICQRVRCAGVEKCPKGQFLVWDDCGCCRLCSKTPTIGICGSCERIHCKEDYPICEENQVVTIDSCGCCRVCKDVIGEGASCTLEGFSTEVCEQGLLCLDGICKKPE